MSPIAELPLILFTLLCQLAVGMLLVGLLADGFKAGPVRARLSKQCLFALVFVALGAILSMIHLGNPLHSPYTLLNVFSSWLSREIWMVLLTGASLAALVWARRKDAESRQSRILMLVSTALGLLLIFVMSKVYNSSFLPGWEGASTFFLFLASAIILGAFWDACALTLDKKMEIQPKKTALWRIFFIATAGFVLLAICVPLSLPEGAGLNQLASSYSLGTIALWQGIHASLCGIGLVFFAFSIWKSSTGGVAGWTVAALLLGICGEVAGRSAFYMAYARLGM